MSGEVVAPLACLECGEPDYRHKAGTSTTLEDHRHAAEFFKTCPGDLGVQHRLYPEAFPTPGPYRFRNCEPEWGGECWHAIAPDESTLNDGLTLESEADARLYAAEYEGE